ncbi:hypothetical protein V8E51_006462 [Hyaloscypha variabilis]
MTERTAIRQSMVDDDAISLTSTAVSEYDSEAEFSVDRILAEKTQSGKKRYLIFWEGYPLEKATWEPDKNINDEILDAWKERKAQESKGLEPPFNVAEFDALLARLAAEKADRRRRRKAKRKRIGRAVSPSASEADDSDSSIEAIEQNEVEDMKPGSKRKSKSPPKRPAKALKPANGRRGSTSSLASIDAARKLPVRKASGMSKKPSERSQPPSRQASEASRHSRTLSHSSSDTPVSRKRPLEQNSIDRPSSSSSEGPLSLKRPKPAAAAPRPPVTRSKPSTPDSMLSAITSKPPLAAPSKAPAAMPKPTATTAAAPNVWRLTAARKTASSSEPSEPQSTRGAHSSRGRVATRGGGNVAHKNVFQAREPPKKRGTLLKNAMDPEKPPKKFSNMRLHRKAELQARDLAEGAPDISALGGLFDPSRPDSMIPIRPENLRKTSSNMVSFDTESNPLFVNSRESSPAANDLRRTANNQPQPPAQIPSALRGMSTCYYWDKQQRGTDQPPCQMGTACRFLHKYVPGMPIAPPPVSIGTDVKATASAGPAQTTCFFWDRGTKLGKEAGCGKGDACPYQHRHEDGMPIAPPPAGWVEIAPSKPDSWRPNNSDDGPGSRGPPRAPIAERESATGTARSTCYFWDRAKKDSSQAECSRGDACTYHHGYIEGMPIAPPPPGFHHSKRSDKPDDGQHAAVPSQPPIMERKLPLLEGATCYYWDRAQRDNKYATCSRGDSCSYYHGYEAGMPIAPPPPSIFTPGDGARDPSTEDFAPWPDNSSRNGPQNAAPQPPWRGNSGATSQAGQVQEDIPGQVPDLNAVLQSLRTTAGGSGANQGLPPVSPPKEAPIPVKKSATRPPWDVYNPTNAVCYFWYNSKGHCSKGTRCKYAHEDLPSLPLAPSVQEQMATFKKTTCRDWQWGECRFDYYSCRYLHEVVEPPKREVDETRTDQRTSAQKAGFSPQPSNTQLKGASRSVSETRTSSNNSRDAVRRPLAEVMDVDPSTTPTKPIRPPWNPSQPYNAICYSLRTTGDCADGHNCKYRHGDDPSLPLAPSPREQRAYHSMVQREEAAKVFKSKISDTPPRNESSKGRAEEALGDVSSLLRKDSPSRKSILPPGNAIPEPKHKAALERHKPEQSSKDATFQQISPHSPVSNPTLTPPRTRPRPAWNPREPFKAICFFYAASGACPDDRDCQYIHSNDRNLAVAPSPLEVGGRPAWNSRDPLHAICYFLASTGSCKLGTRCKFIHSGDPSLPIAPSPNVNEMRGLIEYDERGRPTCKYWLRDDCRDTAQTCRWWHGPPSAKRQHALATNGVAREQLGSPTKPTPTGPRMKSVSFAADEDMPLFDEPEPFVPSGPSADRSRPIKTQICWHWTQGQCYHGAACWNRHEYATGEGPNQLREDVPMSGTAEKNLRGPTRSSEGSRDFEMQDRVEKRPTQISTRQHDGSKNFEMQAAVEKQQMHISIRRNEGSRDIEMKDMGEKSRPPIARKPSVRFAMNEDELPTTTKVSQPMPHPGIIKPLEVSAVVPNPSSGSADLATKINPKMKIDDFRRKKALKELGNRAKEVTFGLDESQSLMLDVGDLSQALRLPWGLSFSGITKILFDQMCIAQDFQVQQGLLQRSRLWHGNMLPADSGDSETIKAIDKAADELICRSAGLLSSIQDFLVLVFPAKRDEWKFLEGMLDYSQDARLRYFIFQSNIDIRQSFRIKPTSLDIGASYREVLVEKIHGLDIKRILPIIKRSKPKSPNVYLLFPSTAAQTAEFIISWLRSSNRNCKIYTSQSEGSWQFFTHNPEIDQATVLVHELAAAELHRLPNLYSMVVEKNYSFWYISESSSPYPLFPTNTYHFDDATMGQLNAVRLFPHGCAFLLTPSFLVAEPHNAIQILSWFILSGSKSKYLSSTPRTWKLVCCHDLLDYTLEIANSKAAEKDALELKHRDNPAKDAILHEAGLSFPECNNRYKLHRMLVEFDSKRSLDSYSECDSDEGESEYPFIHANKHIDPDNEKALVEWFAAWTMRNLDMYKKFVVVGSSEAKYKDRLTRLREEEIVKRKERVAATESPKPPSFKTFSITKKASASPMESPRSPLSAQKQKALAVAARLSVPSPSKNANQTRIREQNSFDDLSVKAASSPSIRSGQISRLSSVQSPQEAHGIGLGINLDEQISELIAESSRTLPRAGGAGGSHSNGSSNQTPISTPGNRPQDHRSPPQPDADDQSVAMDLDSPMLGFDGAGDDRPTSSSSSRSGIQADETGRRFVPRSIRPDASVRKEIPVRPGYIPPEDGDFYQIPSRRDSAVGTPSGQSAARTSSVADGESENERKKMNSKWQPAESVEDGEIEEVVRELKEVKFEATTSWYRKEVKEGRGWEHIRVEGFEAAAKTLGITK